jgi:hypothetical protein
MLTRITVPGTETVAYPRAGGALAEPIVVARMIPAE